MDNVDLNNSPDLTMEEITKQLFNNEFESDVQFLVEGKTLFAHSWELSKRSKVFCEQFRGTLGENKLIPVTDTTYKVFYQFLRFIYTDVCDLEEAIIADMLKLAVKYKIVKLENKVLNMGSSNSTDLTLLEFSLEHKYELNFNQKLDWIICDMNSVVKSDDEFFKIKSNVLEIILKSDRMPKGLTEINLFNNLVRWMNKSCELNGIPLAQRRSQFGQLLRLIRFPLMTVEEFNLCHKNHPDLFTNDDISTICTQIILKGHAPTARWLAQPRLDYTYFAVWKNSAPNQKWITKFTVSENLIMRGLRFGSALSDFEIHISKTNPTTNTATKGLTFNFAKGNLYFNTCSLGETLKLKPNVIYTIDIKYRNAGRYICRDPNVKLIITGPSDLITIKEMSDNLVEIVLKLATN